MLNLDYLLEEAKTNGMPIIKKRGILREYLQVIILNSVYKHNLGKLMFFTGGTALRFFYNMPRFSEDLDFDTPGLNHKDFDAILDSIRKGLTSEGFSVNISSKQRGDILIAELYFKDLMNTYGLTDKRGMDVMIKIEVYKPSWNLRSQSGVLSLYGYNFSFIALEKDYLLSEKLLALFNRRRGRDIYDTLFMLKKKFPFNEDVLMANDIKVAPREAILNHLKDIPQKELKFLADQVKPFLFKEDDIELVLNAPLYAERFLAGYGTT